MGQTGIILYSTCAKSYSLGESTILKIDIKMKLEMDIENQIREKQLTVDYDRKHPV